MKLESERLILRPMNIGDKVEIFAYRSDNVTNEFQGWIPKTIGDVEIFIDKIAKQVNEPDTWFQFVLIEKVSQKIIGDLGIHFLDKENKQVEIGCTLNKSYQKKGFAIESVRRVIDYLFKELNKHRIIASIDPRNANSIQLVERLGFRKEVRLVETVFVNER